MSSETPSPIEAAYETEARAQMEVWRAEVLKGPSLMARAARGAQLRINEMIPEKVHAAVATAMEKMTRVIITGSDLTTAAPLGSGTLRELEAAVEHKVAAYRAAAAAGATIDDVGRGAD